MINSATIETADVEILTRRRERIVAALLATPLPLASVAIHVTVAALWCVLLARALLPHGLLTWSVGLLYVGYDASLQVFVFTRSLDLLGRRGKPPVAGSGGALPGIDVVIAALDEATVLERTIRALDAQTHRPRSVILADDGSTDGTALLMSRRFGLAIPPIGGVAATGGAGSAGPVLRWLRLPHGGKARALNAGLLACTAELVVTVDADTALGPDGLAAMARAFAADAGLVAATGVLAPRCAGAEPGRALFEWFQKLEYVRNFLARRAWMRADCLLLISGAFAGFRRDALLAVGGFDPDCLVEDYEVIHRLRRHGALGRLGWRSAVVGEASADTAAPSRLGAFLRQRRRWFGGFLQTQRRYGSMAGDRRFGALGLVMLPVKAVDTVQPIYGLTALALLLFELARGRLHLVAAIAAVIAAKIVLDGVFLLFALVAHRRWTGRRPVEHVPAALLSLLVEPFSFQILRHLGALWGWGAFLSGTRHWGRDRRPVLAPVARSRQVAGVDER